MHRVALVIVGLLPTGCGERTTVQSPQPSAAPAPSVRAEPDPARPAPAGASAEAVVREAAFELRARAGGPYTRGTAGSFGITLTPGDGWHVNEEYPIRVELTAPPAVALARSRLERTDAADFGPERARFDVGFTPNDAGDHRVEAKVSFAVCTPENCLPDERTVAVVLPVR
ncbi:MAG: hypothetical protein NZ898_09545 [Myxococcota bacterium]|nr:hypothetical protein [Myxococcota bacterium]MDW8361242.1 hypothetical protein [Myxococcales bacterium]